MTVVCGPERWPFWQPAASLSENRTRWHSPRRRFNSREQRNPDERPRVRLRIASIFVNADRLDRARPLLDGVSASGAGETRWSRSTFSGFSARSSSLPAAWRARRTMLTGPGRSSGSTGRTKPRRSGRSRSSQPIAATWSVHAHSRCGDSRWHLDPWFTSRLEAVLGLVAAWSGDPHGAVHRFDAAERLTSRVGWLEPTLAGWRPDHVEALLELGRVDEAVSILNSLGG